MAKVVLITGVVGGIGRSLVRRFMDLNYVVVATDSRPKPEDLIVSTFVQIDLLAFASDKQYATEKIKNIREFLGDKKLQVIINNAAIQKVAKVSDVTRENWEETLLVNLTAPFFLIQSFLEDLELTNGSVLNISSIHSRLTKKNFLVYSTSKAAISAMTRALTIELGDKIRFNAIEPAAINTAMLLDGFENDLSAITTLANFHPSGVIGDPDNLAKLAQLITENNDIFFNGAVIQLDGGISSRLFDPS